MLAPRWKISRANTTNLGISVLESKSINPRGYWYWLGSIGLLGFSLLFNVLYTLTLAYLNPFGKPQAAMSDETLEEMPVQQQGIEQEPKVGPSMSRQGSLAGSSSSPGGNNTIERQMRCMSNRSVGVEGINNNESDLEAAKGVGRNQGMILPFSPVCMSFEDVNYFIDMPREMKEQGVTEEKLQLLHNVTGSFRPCVLTALMGLSGAGKTTLMDVLAERKTGGYIEGDIRVSGFPKKQETFARISSYCEQNDLHSPQVTVRESLIYSAFLRLPKGVDENTKISFVDEIMELVELHNLKDALVGLPGVSGLPTGQRKRLTIAVELASNPSIIFMDEPTSGLDARAAAIVMRVLRNTVDTGRVVVCTIHQPSIDIFESFDELLLMKRGGNVIYAGPIGHNSHKIVEYFESIPGVPEIKDKDNPTTWMLEVISMASEHRLGIDFAEHYTNSCLYQRNKALVKELSTPAPGAKDLYFATQYSQSLFGQFKLCLWKQWRTYWRSPSYNSIRFFFTLLSALFLGMVLWKQSTKWDSNSDILQMIGAMYVSILFLRANNLLTVQPVVAIERTVFNRERATRMYSVLPYALAQIVVEIPYIFGQTILYTFIVYNMMSFKWTLIKFSWFFFMYFFTFLCFTYYGMMTFSISPNHQVASILAVAFFHLFNLFSGFFIPRPKIPKWWIWFYWFCPLAWSIDGLISSQYGDLIDPIHISADGKKPLNQYVEDYFGYKHGFLGQIVATLVGFSVLFAFIFGYGLKVLNFQQR